MRLIQTVAQSYLGLRRQRVIPFHDGMDDLRDTHQHIEVYHMDRLEYQGQIASELGQIALCVFAITHLHRKRHPRMVTPVSCGMRRHKIRDQRLRAGHRHMPPSFAGQISHLASHPPQVGLLHQEMLHQQLTGRVQAHTTRQAFKNFDAKLFFEPLDPTVQGRGRDVHIVRRFPD